MDAARKSPDTTGYLVRFWGFSQMEVRHHQPCSRYCILIIPCVRGSMLSFRHVRRAAKRHPTNLQHNPPHRNGDSFLGPACGLNYQPYRRTLRAPMSDMLDGLAIVRINDIAILVSQRCDFDPLSKACHSKDASMADFDVQLLSLPALLCY